MKKLLILMSFVCSFVAVRAQDFIPNQVQVETWVPILWDKDKQTTEFLSQFPVGSKVIRCANNDIISQQPQLAASGKFFGTLFLVELPSPIATSLVSSKDMFIGYSGGSSIADVRLNKTGESETSTAIPFTDPVFPYDMQYSAAAIAGGVKYTGWQHANGYVFANTDRILVAVIDGGANLSHQDAVNSYHISDTDPIDGLDNDMNGKTDDRYGWNFVANNNNVADDNPIGHGTVVCSELAARNNNSKNTVGYLSDTLSVLVLKAANSAGTVTDFNTAAAYYYALGKHARVVNMSFGFSSIPTSLMAAIATGVVAPYNCVPVAAVGNTGGSYTAYPASGAHVLTVGNANNGGVRDATSSYSSELDIMAVGVSVAGHHPTSTTLNTTLTGTSQAAPRISGVCNKILKADSTLTVDEVIDLVRSRGLNHGFLSMTGWGYFSGMDTLLHDMMSPDTVVTFAACSGKQCLPYSKHFAPVDSMRFGLAAIVGDSVNTNLLSAGTYTYKLAVKFEPRPGEFFRDTFSLKVIITGSSAVTPTISINATPSGAVCAGTSVNFTSTITDGGASPTYVWKVNTITVGTASSYSYIPVTGDVVYAILTSSAGCASPATVNSNTLTPTVTSTTTSTASVAPSPSGPVCAGTSVTYSATTSIIGGTYQWTVNGSPVGGSTATYAYAPSNTDIVKCTVTPISGCYTGSVTSAPTTATVNPTITSTASVTASTGTTICAGTGVTFTCTTSIVGGTFQWYVNGILVVGATSSTYFYTPLPGDVITCQVTPSTGCYTGSVTSAAVSMTVNPVITSTASISASPGTTVCTGSTVTFTCSTSIVGGTYQWNVNGIDIVGATAATYAYIPLSGDVVKCTVTPGSGCYTGPVTSSSLTMTVSSSVTPGVTIAASPGTTVCAGTIVTFTATPSGGGASPTFQWYKNGIPAGTGITFSDPTLVGTDVITCELTSSLTCVTVSTAMSSPLSVIFNSWVTPAVAVAVSPSASICSGTPVTFTATPSAGGTSPTYQWFIGTTPVGTGNVFMSSTLLNGDAVKVIMTSVAPCASPTTATSVITVMSVVATVAPSATINAVPGTTICPGTPVNFTSSITNGGATPTYAWKKNGVPVGTGSSYSSSTLINGDVVILTVTGSAACSVPSVVNSNTITVTVNTPIPVPSFTISGTAVLVSAGVYKGIYTASIPGSVPSYTLKWFLNGDYNNTTIGNSWVHDPLTNGHPDTVYAVLTPTSGCYSPDTFASGTILLKSPVGIAVLTTKESIHMYPNPVRDRLTVEGVRKGSIAVVINVLGQVVKNYTFMNDNSEQIELTSLVPGVYTLRILDEDGASEFIYKITKE